MKKLYTLIVAVLLAASTFAQAPEKMSYQAVVRDAANTLVTNQAVGMQISILQGGDLANPGPTVVYSETQTPTTNANGLVTLEIGTGAIVSGIFANIDWSASPYFIQTGTDPTGGTNYTTLTSTSQLMSVPFALHTKQAANGLPAGGTDGQILAINGGGVPEWTNPSTGQTYYLDTDDDGYGDINNPIVAFSMPIGYASNNTDCDDTPITGATIYPGATEVVDDGIDQDCDGVDLLTWYADADGDTYGDATNTTTATTKPAGYVGDKTDCNDTPITGATIYPGATEVVDDGIDQDCDGLDVVTWYADADGDTYGDASISIISNTQPAGYVADKTDCDDTPSGGSINPATVWYLDADGDNYAVSTVTQCVSPGAGYTTTVLPLSDCDDSKFAVNPGVREILANGIDDDCDDIIDEPVAIGDYIEGGIVFWIDPANNTKGKVCYIKDIPYDAYWNQAILACNNLNVTVNGIVYEDWYLPSKDELNLLYLNKAAINTTALTKGGSTFELDYYWSSTATTEFYAMAQNFNDGSQLPRDKNWFPLSVRAVRAF